MSDRIIVTSQAEMDKVPQGYDGIVEVRSNPGVWIRVPSGLNVRVYGSSQVEVHGSSRVRAYGNTQILRLSDRTSLSVTGNARIVELPDPVPEQVPCQMCGGSGVVEVPQDA